MAGLLGGAAGRVALDDEEFGLRRIALLAIGELAGKRRDIERTLAPRELARLARRLARGGGLDDLGDDRARLRGMFLEPGAELLVHQVLDHRADFGGDELVLGLGGELRVRHLDGEHAGQRLARVIARQLHLLLLGDAAVIGVVVDDARQRAAEAREMRAAVALGNVVGEAQHVLMVAVVPPQGAVDRDAVLLAMDHDGLGEHGLLGAVEIAHEGRDAAFVEQLDVLLLDAAVVGQQDAHAGIQEGQLAQAVLERREVELGLGEGFRRGQEGHFRAALVGRIAHHLQRRIGLAMGEAHEVLLAIAEDGELELGRERVDDGDADAVEAARHLVGILVELSAGMQLGHDDFGRGHALALVDVGGDAAAVVGDRAGAIGVERHRHAVGMAGERLVDGVVHHLIDHVVQARAVIGVADVHAGALAHGVQSLQDLDRTPRRSCAVAGVVRV